MIINSPTSMTYLLGRTNVVNQSDLLPTQKQLFSYEFNPLNEDITINNKNNDINLDIDYYKSLYLKSNLNFEKKNPVEEIFAMTAREYYTLFTQLLVENPPIYPQDSEIIQEITNEFGIVPGEPWKYSDLTIQQQHQLEQGMIEGIELLNSYPTETYNDWTLPSLRTGNYSSDYYLRAYIALVLYAANLPQDAVYYNSKIYTSSSTEYYTIIFNSPNDIYSSPPTNQFWSITMYTEEGYLVPNQYQKYSISSQQDLQYGPNGEIHITISTDNPIDNNNNDNKYNVPSYTNWLPAPQNNENFDLTLRIYWPQDSVLSGEWLPPPVTRYTTTQ